MLSELVRSGADQSRLFYNLSLITRAITANGTKMVELTPSPRWEIEVNAIR